MAALQSELDQLKAQIAEKDRGLQFWYDKASKADGKPAAAAATPAEDDVDLLEVVTTKGVKGLLDVLKKSGQVISKDEVDALVNTRAAQLTTEQQLLKDYPELSDKKSDFFQNTAQAYGELKNQGVPEAVAMQMAAERTELALIRTGKRTAPAQRRNTESEADRRTRIAAQSGDNGGRGTVQDPEDEELTPEQKRIATNMGISEDAYKARAKKGVQMGGRGK